MGGGVVYILVYIWVSRVAEIENLYMLQFIYFRFFLLFLLWDGSKSYLPLGIRDEDES